MCFKEKKEVKAKRIKGKIILIGPIGCLAFYALFSLTISMPSYISLDSLLFIEASSENKLGLVPRRCIHNNRLCRLTRAKMLCFVAYGTREVRIFKISHAISKKIPRYVMKLCFLEIISIYGRHMYIIFIHVSYYIILLLVTTSKNERI